MFIKLSQEKNPANFLLFQGIFSEIGDTEIFEVQPDAFQSVETSTSNGALYFIFSLMLIGALAGTIVFLMQRHRRLQNSFSRFANSHYDTKTGATRIGTNLDIMDDDDHQEVPPRFADDEPLVLA